MKSASNGGILKGRFQVLRIHVFLVVPLGTGHMAQLGTDQHESRVTARETAHHTSAVEDLSVQSFNDIIGADTSPAFTREIAIVSNVFGLNAEFNIVSSHKESLPNRMTGNTILLRHP